MSPPRSVPRAVLAPINEKTFQDKHVIPLAEMFGWWVYHPTLSRWSARGWPDLAMVRPPRLVLAELKSEAGVVSADQQYVLDLLGQVPGIECYLWRPSDLDEIARLLR